MPIQPESPHLPIGSYRLSFQGEAVMRTFPGSAWRGALGHILRELACLTGAPECTGCTVKLRCAYAYVFDTPPPPEAEKMRRYQHVPHPFVLRESLGDTGIDLYLTLVGRSNAYLPLIVLALQKATVGTRGIAGRRLQLTGVGQDVAPGDGPWIRIDGVGGSLAAYPPQTPSIPSLPTTDVALTLHTPLRVKRDGQRVGAGDFRFADLFGNLLRRVSMLSYFHTDTPFETDFRGLMVAARSVESKADLRWVELPRHSARQQADMSLGGLVGTLRMAAAEIAAFWPLLWVGQFIHAGSAATMGLGYYTLASLPRADPDVIAR